MTTHRTRAALHALGYEQEYESAFSKHALDDDLVAQCVENMDNMRFLDEVIPLVGHRLRFIDQFKKTGVVLPGQAQQSTGQAGKDEGDKSPAHDREQPSSSSPLRHDRHNLNKPTLEALTVFKSSFKKKFGENEDYLDDEAMDKIFKFSRQKAFNTLHDILASSSPAVNPEKIETDKLGLGYLMEEKMQKFIKKNTTRKTHEEGKLKNHVAQLVADYQSAMKKGTADICLTDECLEIHHGQAKQAASAKLRAQFSKLTLLPPTLSNLESQIERKFAKIRDTNAKKRHQFETNAELHVERCKNSYVAKLKKLVADAFDMDELQAKNEPIRADTIKNVRDYVIGYQGNPNLLARLLQDLDDHMASNFEEYMTSFEMNLEEDEVKVRTAQMEITSFYNDEMEKKFQETKDFIPPARLLCISEEIKKTAISRTSINLTEIQLKKLENAMDQLYLKFEEKNVLLSNPSLGTPGGGVAIGIDLGTTFSCVGVWSRKAGGVTIIHNEDGNQITPSYVAFTPEGDCLVGEAAKEQADQNPQNTIFDAKRLIGRKFSDPIVQRDIKLWPFDVVQGEDDQPRIKVGDKTYAPQEISALVLTHLKNIASAHLNVDVVDAVITVPANFNDAQRQATRDAGEIAGLNVLKILNEPTAAAIAYNLHASDKVKRNVFIFDLGGGTFDVAVLSMTAGDIQVKCVRGDTHLGGEDFDNALVDYCISHMKVKSNIDLERDRNSTTKEKKMECLIRLRRIRNECEKRKRLLSQKNVFTIDAHLDVIDTCLETGNAIHLDVPIERHQFEKLNDDHFKKCMRIVEEALVEAKLNKRDIHDVVLVGGSSRIPKVQELLFHFFDRKTLSKSVNPDEAVAVGAAVQAALLKGKQNVFLRDGSILSLTEVATHSIGIKTTNQKMDVIIPKNTVLPFSATKSYKTVRADQSDVVVKVFEGEDTIADNNRLLGRFVLTNIPKPTTKDGREWVDVVMTISDDGILKVTATCRSSKSSNDLKVVANTGRLSAEQRANARDAMRVKGRLDSTTRPKFSLLNYFSKVSPNS